MMRRKSYELKEALKIWLKTKDNFIELSNNKKIKKRELISAYKAFKQADDNFISVYEKLKSKKEAKYKNHEKENKIEYRKNAA